MFMEFTRTYKSEKDGEVWKPVFVDLSEIRSLTIHGSKTLIEFKGSSEILIVDQSYEDIKKLIGEGTLDYYNIDYLVERLKEKGQTTIMIWRRNGDPRL